MPFKVLLVYANLPREPLMPLGIAMLATALGDAGFAVRLFDTTPYADPERDNQAERVMSGQIKPCDTSGVEACLPADDMAGDFAALVREYAPGLIGVSCGETTYPLARELMAGVRHLGIPCIAGGVFPSFSPEKPLLDGVAHMVCVGEGEEALVEVARQVEQGRLAPSVANVWTLHDGVPSPPPSHQLCDLSRLPVPRFDIFDPRRIYRPMAGQLYRMLPLEISRGCPYQCSYCSAPSYRELFARQGKWLRFKPVERILKEARTCIERYGAQYLYLVSETFLAMPAEDRRTFYREYGKLGVPFWFNTRPETVTPEDMRELAAVGCHRVSIGVESGNEEFRRTVLRRNYSNDTVVRAVEAVMGAGIQLSVNNMIGFPDETREMVFDTIRLNRRFTCDSHTLSIFHPFRGTALHRLCVEKGYWSAEAICAGSFSEPKLEMPSMTREVVKGLYRTFNLYRALDESLWDEVQRAEALTPEGDAVFEHLRLRAGQS